MFIGSSSPFQTPQAGFGASNGFGFGGQGGIGFPGAQAQGGFGANGLNGSNGIFMQGMQMMQMALMTQMTQMMKEMLAMMASSAAAPGSAAFGGASGSGSPAEFLGTGGTGGASSAGGAAGTAAAGAKDAGGGWTNPIGGSYKVSSGFGPRKSPTAGASSDHKGIDLAAPLNTPILAAKAGKVTVSKDQPTGYGKWIEIQHEDGSKSRYGHLNARQVEVGAQVAAGQQIGKMGSTGTSTGSHLHFEVLNAQGQQVDPAKSMRL